MTTIVDVINQYKAKSAVPIREQQLACIPKLETDQIEYIATHYFFEGKRVPVNITNQMFIKLKFMNFISYKKRTDKIPRDPSKLDEYKNIPTPKNTKYQAGIFPLQELVDNRVVVPFMLFINGWFIPWECIEVVFDSWMYYLIINGAENEQVLRLCKNCTFVQIVTLPEYFTCVKNPEYIDGLNNYFSFDEVGKYDTLNPTYYIVSKTGYSSTAYHWWHTTSEVNAYRLIDQTDIKLSFDNIMLFVNGLFSSGVRTYVPRAIDNDAVWKDENGYIESIHPCLDFTYSQNLIIENPEVRLDSVLLSINKGKNPSMDTYDFGLFINPDYTPHIDNISQVDLDGLAEVVKNINAGLETPAYFDDLSKPFELEMSHSISYEDNIINSLRTLSRYNAKLFNPMLLANTNLVIEEHDYGWIQEHAKGGAIIFPISHGSMQDEVVIVLVNGRKYKYSHMIKYFANKVTIPIQGIGPDDTVEFLRIKNINNYEKKVIINEDDGFVEYSPDYVNTKMCFFTKDYNGAIYDYPDNDLCYFEIEYTMETDAAGRSKILLKDPYYYGKELIMVYLDRFKWETYTIADTGDKSEYCIDLKDNFKFCNQYGRYVVFLNDNRLSANHFRLTLPTRPTTPFTEFKLYLTIPVHEGDRLDIMYTPTLFQDIVVNAEVPVSGDIIVDKRVLDYGLSTELFMVWINGKKVPKSHISDIDSNHIIINTDEKSTKDLCITKFIPSTSSINAVFDDNIALWDTIIAKMTREEINQLLGIPDVTLTDTEGSMYTDTATIKQIMNELIRDEIISNPAIDLSGPFVFDYFDVDSSIVSDTIEGVAVLETGDANHTDNLGILEREQP